MDIINAHTLKALAESLNIEPDVTPTYVPEIKKNYLPDVNVKNALLGISEGHVYIYGETGLGKTELVYYMAAVCRKNIREINMTGSTTTDNFVGYLSANQGTTVYYEGILLECMRRGYWLLLDEIDYASPEVLSVLNNVLQNGFYTIPETREKVKAHANFRVVATANTVGGGDRTGHYRGTRILNRALLDRFESVIEVNFPDDRTLRTIIVTSTQLTDMDMLDKVISYTNLVRQAIQSDSLVTTFGIRSILKIVRKIMQKRYSIKECINLSFGNTLDPDARNTVLGMAQRVFGDCGV